MPKSRITWSAIWFVIVASILGAIVERATQKVADRLEERFGYVPDPVATRRFLDELGENKYFAQAAPEAMEKAEEVDTFLYRAMEKAHVARYGKPYVVGRQEIGDCISWGAATGVYCAESLDWELGKLEQAPLLPCTEAIYGGSRVEARSRPGDGLSPVGGWSDGSTGSAAAKWLRDWGVIYREHYGDLDLSTYSGSRAKQWGAYGCGGQNDGGKLDAVAKEHPCKHVVAVRTWDELVGAITSGFPVTIASSVGFNTQTDTDGFLRAETVWQHQMVILGLRFAKNSKSANPRDGALVMNSWGPSWLTYAGKYPADQPAGSFWATRATIENILSQGDCWAIGSVDGFGWRDISHGEWLMPAPQAKLHKPSNASLIADTFKLGL